MLSPEPPDMLRRGWLDTLGTLVPMLRLAINELYNG
jgi:hypothetical protein